jgi:L-threonylcarbamoyladenylate synthase
MRTEITEFEIDKIDLPKIKKAARLIDDGNLVAFPTETVYGIASRVANDSLKLLSKVKNRTPDKYYALHIDKPEKIDQFVPSIGLRAKKLVQKALPGPLTIVFQLQPEDIEIQRQKIDKEVFDNLYLNNSIGIRCPDHPVASKLLSCTKFPVVAPSANLTGQPPAVDAQQVFDSLNGKIPLILDGGPCKYKKNSTVAKITSRDITVLREGVFTQNDIEKMSQLNFLFVCTGNSCRSPMAEGIFRKFLAEKLNCNVDQLEKIGYKTYSAGTMGIFGMQASIEAVKACAAKDVDITKHKSTGLTKGLIEDCDLIFTMTASHRREVIAIEPDALEKCFTLADTDIADPIGQGQKEYNACAKIIEMAVKERIGKLKL